MQLILVGHGNVMAGSLGVIAAPFAACFTEAAGGGPQVTAGAAKVHADIMGELIENLFELVSECTRCMHCINVMPRALRPGLEQGATLLVGAKAPILDGAQIATMIVPFVPMSTENEFEELKEVIEKCWDWWMEEGKNRERIGESVQRIGLPTFLQVMEVEPLPQHVKEPRSNPYVFWKAEEVPGGFERDLAEFRKRNPM